ncbi:MAG: AAA family ATPase [Pseudobacteriovorax sp.]|nr:AAA family ATPase [Pseudobacteriovorax sp.]
MTNTAKKTKLPKKLSSGQVFTSCPVSQFSFKTTKDLKSTDEIFSQERAIRAINVGLGIRSPGYNIYVAGIDGTGKTSVINRFLQNWSKKSEQPDDWIYLYNFQESERPVALRMPAGDGKKLKKSIEKLVKALHREIPLALQSEDYENAVNSFYSAANETKAKLYSDLEVLAKRHDFVIKSTRVGIETIPVIDGRPLSEKDYSKLSNEDRSEVEQRRSEFEPEILDFARRVRAIDKDTRDQVDQLRDAIGEQLVAAIISEVHEEFESNPDVISYLNAIRDDVKENLLDFVDDEEKELGEGQYSIPDKDRFSKYKVNLIVDNSQQKQAPVVIENNPTYYNLFGKIEKNVEHGMYLTDFTMIKAGAIHRANGGYLVLNALDIFRTGNIWESLKRVLKNRQAFIEDMGEQYSLLPTSGLRPDPIPLDLKVILIGTDEIYHILFHEDEEFRRIFKVKADFDYKMPRDKRNIKNYLSFIATRASKEKLLPFERSGVSAIIEHGSRLVEDQSLLSTQFSEIKDLTIEANFMAKERGASTIKRQDVETALNEKYYRLNLYEENLLKMVENGEIICSLAGSKVGSINGLAVYDYGDYAFGKIGRITCTSSVGGGDLINIERHSKLSGRIHDKGVMILSGIVSNLVSRKKKHTLTASLTFEQNYGLIDGDSASVAELIAILSAFSGIPIKQNLAITGSINQHGEVQVIGGVNEKIEGFYKTCITVGNEDEYIALIPDKNVRNLMLHDETRKAVKSGKLKIYPISNAWEAFKLATGYELGTQEIPSDGYYPKGSALAKIMDRLSKLDTDDDS